jgi:hypothetical protein
MTTNTIDRTATRQRTRAQGVARLVRRLERERRRWTLRDGVELLATEQAWRAGVAEGLRLAQTAIKKGV